MSLPTVFHITHQKAGSQWVAEILKYCALERAVFPKFDVAHFRQAPIKPGGVYLTVYISRTEFERVINPLEALSWRDYRCFLQHPMRSFLNWFNFGILRKPCIKFVIIRDLRDALISLYFGHKVNHSLHYKYRAFLNSVDKEQGLLRLMNEVIGRFANIQLSWIDDDVLLIRYEELLADEQAVFEKIINYCQIHVTSQRLHEIVNYNSFETLTGRRPGEEDVTVHQRKALIGDWRNHFSKRVKKEFKKQFGDVLIKTGYERDMNW
jgi:lipopolysaccharide transport system ATP-binding protein